MSADDSFDSFLAELRSEHPWVWRKAQLRQAWWGLIGRFLPRLCRHRSAMGQAGGDIGYCLDCGTEFRWNDD